MASISLSASKARSASDRIAGAQPLAHPLEVLVDADPHQLHLQAELVELLAEPVPHGLDAAARLRAHPKRPVT